ncbi:hypothetical protein EDC96DRAFT_549748 [Choanephora cucurbitarum]|nr:hypothetical protein EDC96DRAFT_549748 [Choanephora cucurbitarum]
MSKKGRTSGKSSTLRACLKSVSGAAIESSPDNEAGKSLEPYFFVSKSMQKSTLQYYPLVVKMKILAACFGGDDEEEEVHLAVEPWVNEMKNQKELKRKARDFQQRAEEQDNAALEVYAGILSCLARKAKRWPKTNLGETTFIHDRLVDILDCSFGSMNAYLFHYEMPLDLYVMETKTPEAHKGDIDFVKMSIMLKHMLDEMVLRDCHVSDAAAYGSVLHGNHVFQYAMILPFNGIYLMKEISIGSFSSSPQEIDYLVRLVPRYLKIMVTISNYTLSFGNVFICLF